MSATHRAAADLARVLAASGLPFNADMGAGLLCIGASLMRMKGLTRDEVVTLVGRFYDIAPALAREAMHEDEA